MSTKTLTDWLGHCPLIAILRGVRPEEVVDIGTALYRAGFSMVDGNGGNATKPFGSWSESIKMTRTRTPVIGDTVGLSSPSAMPTSGTFPRPAMFDAPGPTPGVGGSIHVKIAITARIVGTHALGSSQRPQPEPITASIHRPHAEPADRRATAFCPAISCSMRNRTALDNPSQ